MEFHLHNRVALIFNLVYGAGWLEYREESEMGKERTRPENYRPGYSSAIEELTFPGLARNVISELHNHAEEGGNGEIQGTGTCIIIVDRM